MVSRWLKRIRSRLSRKPPPAMVASNPQGQAQAQAPLVAATAGNDGDAFTTEGIRLCRALWGHFWSPAHSHFVTAKASSETVGDWNGYTLWPFVIGIEALLEAEAAAPGQFTSEIHTALEACEKFKSARRSGAYTAWVYFDGNDDVYYDDDAQLAISLLRAYELPSTRKREYLARAATIVTFLQTGWDEARGGMRWHVSKPEARNACTTNLSAIAALKLVKAGGGGLDTASLLAYARKCVDWTVGELSLDSGLIKDGAGGGPTWTYNTGTVLYAICLLRAHGDDRSQQALRLAEAACDRQKSLFDQTTPKARLDVRYWWDSTFFVHLLMEGLVGFVEVFGAQFPRTAAKAREEVTRHTKYMMRYLKGRDGLYVRNLRLYVVSMDHLKMFREMTGDVNRQAALDESERWRDVESLELPAAQRGVAKTLLGNGGMARCLLIAARIS